MEDYFVTAPHYDDAYAALPRTDLPFYLGLAQERGGPVLDVGCGTGRIALPLARLGHEVAAVDASPAMLDVLRHKLAAEPEEVRARVSVEAGDMRSLDLGRRFPLVLVPFRAFQHMMTLDDQVAALASLRRHLAPEGLLAFDVFLPNFRRVFSGLGEEVEEMSWTVAAKDGERAVRRSFVKDAVDPLVPSFSGRFIYRTYDGPHLVGQAAETLTMTCYPHSHLRLLFRLTGLEVVAEYGTFDKTPLTGDSPEMIFVLRVRDLKST